MTIELDSHLGLKDTLNIPGDLTLVDRAQRYEPVVVTGTTAVVMDAKVVGDPLLDSVLDVILKGGEFDAGMGAFAGLKGHGTFVSVADCLGGLLCLGR